ncbi:MAG: hypothetical protein KC613_00140, partial [Myxococcales bacterium]|nr:hypothetical protein [Myxococcales bacterium]
MAPTVACGMAFQVLGAGVAWRFDVPLAAAYTLDSMWMAATFTAGHFVLRAPSAWPVAPGWLAVALSLALPDWAVELNFFFPLMAVALIGWTERPTRPAR